MKNVSIFVPNDLGKPCHIRFLVGWVISANPCDSALNLVVAGTITAEQTVRCEIRPWTIGATRSCLLGELCEAGVSEENGTAASSRQDIAGSSKLRLLPADLGREPALWIKLVSFMLPSGQNRVRIANLRALMHIDIRLCALTLIRYEVPRPEQMRYLSLEPMVLPLTSTEDLDQKERFAEKHDTAQQERLERLVRLDPVRFADLNHSYPQGKAPGEGFRLAVEHINGVAYLMAELQCTRRNGSKTASSGHNRHAITKGLWTAVRIGLLLLRRMLNCHLGRLSFVDMSASAKQLNLRLGQALMWPPLGRRLRSQRLREQEPVSRLAPHYTALYNGVWLVANDLIMGQAMGSWLCDNCEVIAELMRETVQPLLVTSVTDTLRWLDSWPLGVKLNTPLSRFFCDMFTGMTDVWSEQALTPVMTYDRLAKMLFAVGIATRLFGLSMSLCLTMDAIRLLTLHLTIFFHIQRAIFAFFCSSIVSLFHLFRGKKRNPLRNMRVDHATYDLDQLLLGTLAFTLFLFLWLTVATYYLHFALIRLGIVASVIFLQTGLAAINHLPLFAIMLLVKDPARLPAGVAMHYTEHDAACSHAVLKNVPLGLAGVFRGQIRNLESLRRLPLLAIDVLLGRPI